MEGDRERGTSTELIRLRARVADLEQQIERTRAEARAARDAAEIARTAADDARAAKTQFLATMSHELRTPLNAIDGYAELMQLGVYGTLTDQQRRALKRLRLAQKRLLALVDDVLSFARLESGAGVVELADIAVDELFGAVEATIAPQLEARSQTLTVDQPAAGLTVRCDPGGAEQILLSLLANAVKFSDEGGVVQLSATGAGDVVHMTVTDRGNGIPANRLEDIFDPFVQLTGGIVRDHHGVGLGLAISRELARAMEGEILVMSRPGSGSAFTLVLPAGGATAGAADASRG
jgi:signal transduction histidine kinase